MLGLGNLIAWLCPEQGVDDLAEGGSADEMSGGGAMSVLTLGARARL